jgi:hypothetical protein
VERRAMRIVWNKGTSLLEDLFEGNVLMILLDE